MKQFRKSLKVIVIYLTLPFARTADSCDKSLCPGPISYYNSLGCTPVYETTDDCCAHKYDCDKVKSLSNDKCYVDINRRPYDIGERLRDEDANPCDKDCVCRQGFQNVAAFMCDTEDCFQAPPKPGCYRKSSPLQCCPGEEVCPENPEDRATCIVNGKRYNDGEHFSIESEPDKNCICQPGYAGENVPPFCATPNRNYCAPLFRDHYSVVQNCAPIFYSTQSLLTDCSVNERCQNIRDKVIHGNDEENNTETDDSTCQFGSLIMHRGDELNQATYYSSVCVKCVCEVPPIPSCQKLPDSECDVTVHMPFNVERVQAAIETSIKKTMNGF